MSMVPSSGSESTGVRWLTTLKRKQFEKYKTFVGLCCQYM